MNHWHFTDSKGNGYICGVDPASPDGDHAAITIMFPLETRLTIVGDEHIIKQVVDRINGMTIEWQKGGKYD